MTVREERRSAFLSRELWLAGQRRRYSVYVPAGWSDSGAGAAVLFLHGAGERGLDGVSPVREGLGPALRARPGRLPALTVFPQCLPGRWWTEAEMQDVAMAALDDAMREFHPDEDRVVLTGLSMGGYGAWELAAREPSRFTRLAVICGGIPRHHPPGPPDLRQPEWAKSEYVAMARVLAGIPSWVFHGDADHIIRVSESRTAVATLRELGADVRYTEYAGVAHNSWDRAYADPALAQWLINGT